MGVGTSIAWRNLARERTRLAISAGGVALAVMLILLLRGLYVGITDQATRYIHSVGADLWVAQDGTPGDFFHSVSIIPETAEEQIQSVDGVEEVVPLLSLPVVFRLGSQEVDFRLMGVDPVSGVGGPPGVSAGRRTPGPGEIVVDRVFADNHGVDLGDVLDVRGLSLRVVGIARGGNAVISQFAWASLPDTRPLLGAEGVVNYFVVQTGGGPPEEVGDRITTGVPGVQALTEDEFTDRNTADLREGFLPILWVLVVIALAIGVAVIGLTIYTATVEKSREYGVLKAVGFSNRTLYGIVFQQSLTSGALGFLLGTVLSLVVASGVERLIPSFATSIRAGDVGLAAVAALAMALVSSFVPVRPVARVDPAQVFRA
ncbi:MAG: ABC transporter permease [Actinobacteria bacterium]|nr:ABC transporter permease [Actinomycetota bacterium]